MPEYFSDDPPPFPNPFEEWLMRLAREAEEQRQKGEKKQELADALIRQILKQESEAAQSPAPRRSVYTVENLPKIFAPEKWVCKIEKMQRRWQKVPEDLQQSFDFVSALIEARRLTLEARAPRIILKRRPPPPKPG